MTRRVGVYGGSFDPVHDGHLRPVEEMRRRLSLDEVLYVPAFLAPHKPRGSTVSSHHRFAMVALALDDYPAFRLSDVEVSRETTSYTVETLRRLREVETDAELTLVIGSDSFVEIETWKESREILESTPLAVLHREPWDYQRARAAVSPWLAARLAPEGSTPLDAPGFGAYWVRNGPVTISSTWIREALADGRDLRGSLPPRVEAYLRRHGLYASLPGSPSPRPAPSTT